MTKNKHKTNLEDLMELIVQNKIPHQVEYDKFAKVTLYLSRFKLLNEKIHNKFEMSFTIKGEYMESGSGNFDLIHAQLNKLTRGRKRENLGIIREDLGLFDKFDKFNEDLNNHKEHAHEIKDKIVITSLIILLLFIFIMLPLVGACILSKILIIGMVFIAAISTVAWIIYKIVTGGGPHV